ncbi:MAG: TetR/AcrR family transcriptional regulator [Candidatus Coproplasma sp.]
MKDRIINESIASLRQEGLKFSVDTLAERLNISKKTIYKYFPNKETLAIALYERYYAQAVAQMHALAEDKTPSSRLKMLSLYYDAKLMTSRDIFNKYKLNEALRSYTAKLNDELLEIIFSFLDGCNSKSDKATLSIIINGAFEKLCNEKNTPDEVIRYLVKTIW